MKRHGTLDLQPRSQLRKLTVCKNILYFIHTQIFIVKHYRSRLWLDEQCILAAVLFQSLNWNVKKSRFVWSKNFIPWEALERFLFAYCDASKNSLFRCAQSLVFFVFFLFFVFVFCFFLMYRNSCIRIIRAHFPWDNLFPRRQVRL